MKDTSNTKIGMTDIRFLDKCSSIDYKSISALSKAAGGYNWIRQIKGDNGKQDNNRIHEAPTTNLQKSNKK